MKVGDKLTVVYVPRLGFVKAGASMQETMENIKRAKRLKKEIKEKKERKRLEKKHPGCKITKIGAGWFIENKDAPLDHL
ncbi:hypothetical protein [Cytobacillus oceanisediminis]|uniref:hypothetical protein n=1 Tax=Cytobacillus oceanisediminis TaxID=665099 RepID=UPI00249566F6|nr:hypothetical protein [Cytobacillus oceanisediminis]